MVLYSHCYLLEVCMSWDRSVGIVTGYKLEDWGVSDPAGLRFLPSPHHSDWLRGHQPPIEHQRLFSSIPLTCLNGIMLN